MARRRRCMMCGDGGDNVMPCQECERSICLKPCFAEHSPDAASLLEELDPIIVHNAPLCTLEQCNDLMRRTCDVYDMMMRTSTDPDKVPWCDDVDDFSVQREWLDDHCYEIIDHITCHFCIAMHTIGKTVQTIRTTVQCTPTESCGARKSCGVVCRVIW